MKPSKNRIHCPKCLRPKMQFASKEEAILFLKYNADDVESQTGKRPIRAYYCDNCCCWHVTSKPNPYSRKAFIRRFGVENGDRMFDTLLPVISNTHNISVGLSKELKKLKHNLKFESINFQKCKYIINNIISYMEIVVSAQLVDKPTLDRLRDKLSNLCQLYNHKIQQIA